MAQLTWVELQQAIADRLRETEDISGTIPEGEPDIPYYDQAVIENALYEASTDLLNEIPSEDLEGIGSVAVQSFGAVSPAGLFPGTLKVISVTIKPGAFDAIYVASQPLPPANFVANKLVSPSLGVVWSVYNGSLYFTGSNAKVTYLIAPLLATWQTTPNILPDGFDEERIDRVIRQLQISNFEPQGGI